MRFLICDDHALVRHGLNQMLADAFPSAVIGEAGSGAECLEMIAQRTWDLVLLDITMPGRDGLDIMVEIKRRAPAVAVLVLTMHSEQQYAVRALRTGADGFLNKRAAPEELLIAVRRILSGHKYISEPVAQYLAESPSRKPDRPRHEDLSNRELQVLRMLAAGQSIKAIAAELRLSVKTVSTYHMRSLRKLGLRSDADLVRYADEHELGASG